MDKKEQRTREEKKEFIREKIAIPELYAQLAEGSAGLAQACLELRRTINNDSPSVVTETTAVLNFLDVLIDVMLVIEVLGFGEMAYHENYCYKHGAMVLDKWCDMLKKTHV